MLIHSNTDLGVEHTSSDYFLLRTIFDPLKVHLLKELGNTSKQSVSQNKPHIQHKMSL